MKEKDKKNIKIISAVIFAVVLIALTVACIPLVKGLMTADGRLRLEMFFKDNAVWGIVVFLVLQIIQIVVALIPGGIIQIIAGVAFGGFWGTLLSVIGCLMGSFIVFSLVRRFGKPIVEAFIDSKGIKEFSFLTDAKKLEMMVFILFLIPGIPKDALTYIAPLTKIKISVFLTLATLARIPAMIMSCVFGSSLGDGNIITAVIIFAFVACLGIIGILYRDKIIAKVKNLKEIRK